MSAVYVNKDKFALAGAPPAPPELFVAAKPFTDRVVLRFRGLKADADRIGSAVIKAKQAGDLSDDAATQIWFDRDHVLTGPVQLRYLEARQFALIERYQRARTAFLMMDWPDAHARAALDGFVAAGERALAATLALAHVERVMKSLRQDWRERRRGQPKKLSDNHRAAIRAVQGAIVARIPQRNAEMLLEIGNAREWIGAHGSATDKMALDSCRDEVERDIERFF